MKPIPFPTGKNKNVPEVEIEEKDVPAEVSREDVEPPKKASRKNVATPEESKITIHSPTEPVLSKEEPSQPELTRETPTETELTKEIPEETELTKEMPSNVNLENCVEIDGQLYEIKSTKLKYFRNKMAAAYNLIKAIPLNEFLTYDKNVIDPQRDADQILYDFLVAVFDDADFVHDHYEDMSADCVEKCIQIFGRLNHIDEKEEKARKNKEAQAKP